ncbi:hypothetical protein LMG26788_00588 [Achromobacter pulmonis]|uniref:Glycine zipper family protein n=1 Tax=Achromobacter pulmonis TaxID=1389932 RepID=A0A6S7C1L6_9BURK|nr:hypothetical protein [Achromobacter pulmonis]CAB3827393.1 hypothetical protein LMG26788_00588 [Achromobacter pulmonis]
MSLIVAARFHTFDEASQAARQLRQAGFSEGDIHTFYINTAGEHDRYPLGGDRKADPDARGAQVGALGGAALVGLVFAAVGGLVALWSGAATLVVVSAAGVGAYIGALAGALGVAGRRKRLPAAANAHEGHPPLRQAGVMLALPVSPPQETLARQVLREAGGHDIERAQGRWLEGKWQDFDPLKPPRHVEAPSVTP